MPGLFIFDARMRQTEKYGKIISSSFFHLSFSRLSFSLPFKSHLPSNIPSIIDATNTDKKFFVFILMGKYFL